jgi:hypothetical protein
MNLSAFCSRTLVGLAALAAGASLLAQPPPPPNGFGPGGPGGPGGGRGGFGGGVQPETKLLKQFDLDRNHLLDATERKAAREFISANPVPQRGPGGRGGRFGGGRGEPTSPGVKLAPADVKAYGAEPFYEAKTLRTLFFTFEDPDWEKELEEFHRTDIDLPATLVVDGRTYRDVGVHFRGASSYFMVSAGSKRSLAVSIDGVHEKQALLGARTLNLLNSHEDASFIRPVLYSYVAQHYLPAPRINLVRVVINGENWGVYANAEQFNKEFLEDRFGSGKGARWKVPGSPGGRGSLAYLGEDVAAYKRIYEIKSKDDTKSWQKLIAMTKVLNETPADKLEATLSPLLDIDGALKFLALEVVYSNGDGYWTRTSDYSIGEDGKGRLHIVPHDMNETFSFGGGPGGRGGFGGGGRGGPPNGGDPAGGPPRGNDNGPGGPPPGGGRGFGGFNPGARGGVTLDPLVAATNDNTPLASKLLAVPALRTRYLGYVRDIAENWLDWSKLGPVAEAYHAMIDDDVKRDTRKLESYDDFAASLGDGPRSLKTFAAQRREFLLGHPALKELPAR